MKLQRTNIHLWDVQRKWLRREKKLTGQCPAYLVRLALAEFIDRREAVRKARDAK
jgi:hypothetical protein